jgi:dolichyl-phosphate-mannose--protein O-mannosyl transferase
MLKNFQFASPLTCFGAVTSPFLTATQSEISATQIWSWTLELFNHPLSRVLSSKRVGLIGWTRVCLDSSVMLAR